jgi:hypothetical protein
MKRKNTKTAKARSFMQSNPAVSPNEVAARFGMTKQVVYGLRHKMKKEGMIFPPKAQQLATLAPAAPMEIEMFDFPDEVDATLDARAVDYGKFIEGAEVMQMLKRVVLNALNNRDKTLAHDQAESLDMIIHKIGRIVNGNPDVVDHWLDIAGYAKLVADRLEGRVR